ncbi:MAG TPA: hypothetical protein VKD69_04815 [Vicinamibacterales bacterium]|nr:hypothetical protein [Vicinamibacterales bacterium]
MTGLILLTLLLPPQQHEGHGAGAKPAALMPALGRLHHPIATASAEAQKFFDQGLTFVYAFNHDEAIKSFRRAAELDPASPMPHWGVALALGPNINLERRSRRQRQSSSSARHGSTPTCS